MREREKEREGEAKSQENRGGAGGGLEARGFPDEAQLTARKTYSALMMGLTTSTR